MLMVLKELNPAILGFFFVIERTQLNAAHEQLFEKWKLIAFKPCSQGLPSTSAETCRFQMVQFSPELRHGSHLHVMFYTFF